MEVISQRTKSVQYVMIALGTLLMGIAVNVVFEPLNLVTGGVAGLAIVIKAWTEPFLDGGIPVWLSTFVLNVPIFVFSLILKGKRYLAKTLYAAMCFNIALVIVPQVDLLSEDFVLASIFGGILMGVGLGLVFVNDCSTGGTDLLGVILHHFMKHYSIPKLLFVVDGIIVIVGAMVFGLSKALYAIIIVYITSKVMDNILEGLKFAKLAYVISDHYEAISKEILHSMDRGVTGISARGMYSNNDKKMLLCVVSKKEIVKLVDIIAQIDPRAFVIVSDVREVLGEGFIENRQ